MNNTRFHSLKARIVDHDPDSAGFQALRGYYRETPWRELLAHQPQASLSQLNPTQIGQADRSAYSL